SSDVSENATTAVGSTSSSVSTVTSASPASASSLPDVSSGATLPDDETRGEFTDDGASSVDRSLDTSAEAGSGSGHGTPPQPAADGCTVGGWPAVDPAAVGPFETMTETNVGPAAGQGAEGDPVAFTVFRPADLSASGLCHPVVTWGNGTGSSPNLYKVLLTHLASHGFIVVASDSPNVAQGNPPPMLAGVTWLLEENDNPSSVYYRRVDTSHVGATGHSQGGFATSQVGGSSPITTIAPLCGASPQRNLRGPALLLCS